MTTTGTPAHTDQIEHTVRTETRRSRITGIGRLFTTDGASLVNVRYEITDAYEVRVAATAAGPVETTITSSASGQLTAQATQALYGSRGRSFDLQLDDGRRVNIVITRASIDPRDTTTRFTVINGLHDAPEPSPVASQPAVTPQQSGAKCVGAITV